jgi:hypothetical protein
LLIPPTGRHTTATCGRGQEGPQQVSIYFGITGGRDYRVIAPHFNETHVDQDSEVTRANRYYVGAPALYVVQYPAKADRVFESKIAKACL